MSRLKFKDNDTHKKDDLDRDKYMVIVLATPPMPQLIVPMEWDRGMDQVILVNLLDMPHFGRSKEVNTYVRQLLVCFHGGFMWIDKPYSINVELIALITGFPSALSKQLD